MRRALSVLALFVLLTSLTGATAVPARLELTHQAKGHGVQISSAALAAGKSGEPLLAWAATEGHENNLYVGRPAAATPPVRVNPQGTSVDSLHQPPAIATGPGGEIYVTWSSRKPVPAGGLFASDLQLSRSVDGGTTFDHHLRVNDDRPLSHSFEGLAVAPDGTVLVAWIDSREGPDKPATYLARVRDAGTRLDHAVKLDSGETCVCCRVDLTAGPGDAVAVTWRKVFAGSVRDMVVARSRDGGGSFAPASLVHADNWKITACPHRGGSVAADGTGRLYAVWYTEGTDNRPNVLFATSTGGGAFSPPRRLHTSTASIPDHARLAVDDTGRAVIVWEDSTAVRRRILMRTTSDGGRTLSPVQALSQAIKAYAPDVVSTKNGAFLVSWHEEQFPSTKTIVHTIRLGEGR